MPKHYRPSGKKKEGNAARYMTRSQALKQLQVSLPVFRRLCIIKGIFPREPKKKVHGNHHTYYHVKDIAFLQHEPLLEIFRAIRTHEKKIKRAEAKKNLDLAERLRSRAPTYKLDRIIKERYPKFVDALRDLDDCLTLVHLFAALPALEKAKIEVKRIHNCRRLAHEWQAYICRTNKLRKTFISVKGIYYQAEVEGQKITWLTPHSLQQVLPDEVDFSVLLTFLEVYERLLAVVNFHLYHSIDVKYPPILNPRLEALAAGLYALSRYVDVNAKAPFPDAQASKLSESNDVMAAENVEPSDESEVRLAQLQHQLPSNEPGALRRLIEDGSGEDEDDEDTKVCKKLFRDMKFFLSREVPRESLLFIIPAFGGVVSWDGEGGPYKESDEKVTHQIIDRPTQGHMFLSREYVQPQWVFDCVNARIILPTEGYMVGRVPPPHLSPFVDNEAEGYVPEYAESIARLKAAARNEILPLPGVGREDLEDPQHMLVEGIIDRTEANEAAEKKQKMMALEKQYHDELRKELHGAQYTSTDPTTDRQSASGVAEVLNESAADRQEDASDDVAVMMMSRKQRGILKAAQISNKRKQDKSDKLVKRRRRIEEAKKLGS